MNAISPNALLVVTSRDDNHVSAVADHLEEAGVSWVRLNTEDFVRNVSMTVDPTIASGSIHMRDSQRKILMSDIAAVWYRKPRPIDLAKFDLVPAELDYVEAEVNEVLHGLYSILRNAYWINDPFTTRIAHRKMIQLRTASSLGLRVPASVITNDISVAMAFGKRVSWKLLIKSLGAISVTQTVGEDSLQYGVFARKISKEELLAVKHTISNMPTLYQEYVDKQYELRVVCVGNEVFPCKIFSQELDASKEDYRFATSSLRHETCELPDELVGKLQAYLHSFGLNFGCFDLAFSTSGDYVFFECNPNGQWLWIENMTGAPISKSIAALLESAVHQ